jgi:predicted transcriptional regulator
MSRPWGGSYIQTWERDNTMSQSLVKIAKDLTVALIETWSIPPDSIQETLQHTYATLTTLKAQEESGTSTTLPVVESSPVDWRRSITRHVVTCLECRQTFKQLSVRHLRQHGLDNQSYRTKYGIPHAQPLVARATTERHRQVARETRPWEKAPAYRKGHAGEHPQSTASEAEAVQDETEAARAAATTQPKRQRKTAPKKAAR